MADIIKINAINRLIGTLWIVAGIKQIRQAQSEFTTLDANNDKAYKAFKKIGLNFTFSPKDISYRYTAWDNWVKILDVIAGIMKHFKWEAEIADCDNRADFASAFCSLAFRLNTLAKANCSVYDLNGKFLYLHWVNILVDTNDNVYIFDIDNSCSYQKMTSKTLIMNGLKYQDFVQIIIN